MRAEERRRLLGDEVIARIRARVAEAPEPFPELVEELRRILAPAVRRLHEVKLQHAIEHAGPEQKEVLRRWLGRDNGRSSVPGAGKAAPRSGGRGR